MMTLQSIFFPIFLYTDSCASICVIWLLKIVYTWYLIMYLSNNPQSTEHYWPINQHLIKKVSIQRTLGRRNKRIECIKNNRLAHCSR
ncbi:hypothetical protein FKM82_020122 [Ascaphus truei]